jgi:hypothetical protein
MPSNDTGQSAVVLQFSLTREEVLDAAAARYRAARRPWYLHWPFFVLLIVIGVLTFIVLIDPVADGRVSVIAIGVPAAPITAAIMFANPRLLYRYAVRQLMRGNPAFSLPTTVTVSPAGVSTASAVIQTAVNWTQYPYYAETERAFFLFASDRLGGAVQIMPKRGLHHGGPDSLRTLIASHSQRLG